MMKKLLSILLSLMLLASASLSFAEDAAAETEAPAEEAAPVLLATVNGEEIYTDNDYLNNVIAYYMDYAASYGYDTADEDLVATINGYGLDYTIRSILVSQKAAEFGLDQFTDEEIAVMEASLREQWADIVNSYVEESGVITESSTEDDKAAARADAEAFLMENYGVNETIFVDEYLKSEKETAVTERLSDYLLAGKTITEEDILTYYNDLVKEDREAYGSDVGTYEFYTQYYGQSSYYTPEGYRGITHILLKVDDELLNSWKDLSVRLEEQQSDQEAESTSAEQSADAEATPAPDTEPEPTAEPVTQEMVDAAKQAILDSVQSTVDEIMAKLESGVSFEDLIAEYGTDSGMEDEATRAAGYPVHNDSILWDASFRDAAMALEKVGDVSKPVVSSHGVHILQYLRDIPGGAAELTEEMKAEFRSTLLAEMQNEALNSAMDQWMADGGIVYTEAGEAWKLPEEDAADEDAAAAD